MEKIYSRIEPNKLLHVINRLSDITGRKDIIPEDNFIQCATLKMEKGKTFPPHKHIIKERHYNNQIAQESWVVIKGKVQCIFYDIDDSIIAEPILEAGDASYTLLEDDTIVYEYKTGPYEGQKLDKVFIDEK